PLLLGIGTQLGGKLGHVIKLEGAVKDQLKEVLETFSIFLTDAHDLRRSGLVGLHFKHAFGDLRIDGKDLVFFVHDDKALPERIQHALLNVREVLEFPCPLLNLLLEFQVIDSQVFKQRLNSSAHLIESDTQCTQLIFAGGGDVDLKILF